MSHEDINAYIVFGHGKDMLVSPSERAKLPRGYKMVTFCNCGEYTTLEKMCPVYDLFNKLEYAEYIKHPERLKELFPSLNIRVYRGGMRVPKIVTSLRMDWTEKTDTQEPKEPDLGEKSAYRCKSGVFKYPISDEYLYPKENDFACGTGWCSNINMDKSKTIEGSLPHIKAHPISGIMSYDIMRKGGKGIYYFPICRFSKCQEKAIPIREYSDDQINLFEHTDEEVDDLPIGAMDKLKLQERINIIKGKPEHSKELKDLESIIQRDNILKQQTRKRRKYRKSKTRSKSKSR
jgi:hypothetical protein